MGQTNQERVAALDQELSKSLGDFEGAMADEQIRVAQAGSENRDMGTGDTGFGSGSGGMADSPASQGGWPSEQDGLGTQQQEQGDGSASGGRSSQSSSEAGAGADGSTTPADVGDGMDDDIVARQLREAAEKEKDPELREKLWDEYRKYKVTHR
jgi:hypothetical protein